MNALRIWMTCIIGMLILSGFGVSVSAMTGDNAIPSKGVGVAVGNGLSPLASRDIIVNGSDPNPANRTLTINCQGKDYPLRGNVSVTSGGVLTIASCNFIFEQDTTHIFWFNVQGTRPSDNKSSQLVVRSSTITVDPYIIKAYLPLSLMVQNNAVAFFESSRIQFPGAFFVLSARLFFNNSVIEGLAGLANPWSPSLLFRDSYVVMSGSQIFDQPESVGIAGNMAIPSAKGINDTTGKDITRLSQIDLVYFPIGAGEVMEIDHFDTTGLSEPIVAATLYIVYHTEDDGFKNYNGTDSFKYAIQGQAYASTGITPTAADSNDVMKTYDIYSKGVDTLSEISHFNVYFRHNGPNGSVLIDALWIQVVSKSPQEIALWGSTTLIALDTFMDVDFRSASDLGLHNYINISGTSKFYGFGVSFDMKESGGFALDPAIVPTSTNANGYLFRWLNLTVKDTAGAALPNASIAKGPDYQEPWKTFVLNLNDLCTSNLNVYGKVVIDHVSRTYRKVSCADYIKTFEGGVATLPAFSDHIFLEQQPNSWFGGKYNLTINYKAFSCSSYANLSHYPNMDFGSNYNSVDVTCALVGDHADLYPNTTAWPIQAPLNRPTEISTTIYNVGNAMATDFSVYLNDTIVAPITEWHNLSLDTNESVTLKTMWTPTIKPGESHPINVTVTPVKNEPPNLWWNNSAEKGIFVSPLPDMQPQDIYLKIGGVQMTKPYRAIIESQIEVVADITNTGGSTTGKFDVQFTDGTNTKWRQVSNIDPGNFATLNVLFDLPKKPGTVQYTVNIDPNNTVEEISDNNNHATTTIDVFYGPDLTLSGFTHKSPVLETRSYVNLYATVNDLGVWDVKNVKVTFYKTLNGTTDQKLINSSQVANLTAGGNAQATVNWTLNDGDEGNYTMTTCVNEDGSAVPAERTENKTNNCMTNYMIIGKMQVQITVGYPQFLTEPGIEVEGNKLFVLSGSVVRLSTGAPVAGLRVTITIDGSSAASPLITNSLGGFLFQPMAPGSSGTHNARIAVEGFPDYVLIGYVYVKPTPEIIPLWMLILIIIIVAVVAVVGVLFALGKSARGKMVECGECGTLISESRTTCPKCHAVFEANVVKCSSCLAWIPATANECPKCGVVFVGKKKKGETYEEIMRKQYDEWVETFRKRYRGKVGARFTEPAFQQWFKQQDDHMTFQQWMTAEESKKRGKACPQCGTANPLDAPTCQRCGSEFAAEDVEVGTKPGPPPTGVAPKAVERADTEKLAPKAKAVPAAGEKRRVVKGAPEAGGEIKKRCPTCSAMNPIEKEICIDCGEKLPPAITCTGCNNLIPGDAKFCPVCGKPQ